MTSKPMWKTCWRPVAGRFHWITGPSPALHCIMARRRRSFMMAGELAWPARSTPGIQSHLEIEGEVYLFEISLEKIPDRKQVKYGEISKFPQVRRDLSILVDKGIPVADLLNHVNNMNLNLPGTHLSTDELEALGDLNLLRNLDVFDIYQGEPVAPGKKSVTLGLTFQRFSDTLTDNQVDRMVTRILDSLRMEFDAQLRE